MGRSHSYIDIAYLFIDICYSLINIAYSFFAIEKMSIFIEVIYQYN